MQCRVAVDCSEESVFGLTLAPAVWATPGTIVFPVRRASTVPVGLSALACLARFAETEAPRS